MLQSNAATGALVAGGVTSLFTGQAGVAFILLLSIMGFDCFMSSGSQLRNHERDIAAAV
jgi:hypothetical protein